VGEETDDGNLSAGDPTANIEAMLMPQMLLI